MTDKTFEAPGPGTWTADTTHFIKPMSPYTASIISEPLKQGFKEGTERYGVFMSHPVGAIVNGFYYSKTALAGVPDDAPPGPPPEGFFEQPELVARLQNGNKAIESKLWRQDLKRWDEEVKPDSIRRHRELQSVDLASLGDDALIGHLVDCHENLQVMWYRHHIFTVSAVFPVGMYVHHVCEWTGLAPGEVLGLLRGSSPVSMGVASSHNSA